MVKLLAELLAGTGRYFESAFILAGLALFIFGFFSYSPTAGVQVANGICRDGGRHWSGILGCALRNR